MTAQECCRARAQARATAAASAVWAWCTAASAEAIQSRTSSGGWGGNRWGVMPLPRGGAAGVAVSAQRDRAVADDGAELAVRSAGGLGRVGTADRPAVKAVLTTHSGRRGRVHLQALQGAVAAGLVGGAVLPAVPDHVEPGSGQDADGVRVVVAPADGVAVELVRPGVRVPAVCGEVADRVAQLFVGRPA